MGAEYDPNTRELVMHSQVELISGAGKPMKSCHEGGEQRGSYKERDAKVYLSPCVQAQPGHR